VPVYDTCNLGNSKPVTLAKLLELIQEVTGLTLIIDRKPMQPGDVQTTFADTTKAGRLLGYEPRVPIRDGLALFNDWFLKNRF
jgi:UDP-glucuronate 4-epimerase